MQLFSYRDDREKIKCCENPDNNYICQYCGSVFFGGSYCCIKRAIEGEYRLYLFNGNYTCNIKQPGGFLECAKSLPLIFSMTLSVVLFFILFAHRRGSNYENIDSNFESRGTILSNLVFIIMLLTVLIHSLIFFIPLSFVHLIYLFFFFKGYKTHLRN